MHYTEIAFCLCVLLLSGCVSSVGAEQVSDEITGYYDQLGIGIMQSDTPILAKVTDNTDAEGTFSVSFRAVECGEVLAVTFAGIDMPMDNDTVFPIYRYICTLAQGCKTLQSFELESTEDLDPTCVEFIDMDFDGYLDMSVVWSTGIANRSCDYYRYDANKTTFEETPFFSTWGFGVELFQDTQQIITTGGSGGLYERKLYQYTNGSYSLLRWEYAELLDYYSDTYILYIHQLDYEDNETEIFSTTITEDEYFGDFTIRDDYLRFGKNG